MGKFIDLTGMRFGRLTVLKRSPDTRKRVKWICQCECGNITAVATSQLKSGHTQSCGCLQKERTSLACRKDLTGETFGRLTVCMRLVERHMGIIVMSASAIVETLSPLMEPILLLALQKAVDVSAKRLREN